MIIGSERYAPIVRCSRLLVTEIPRSILVVPEGAAGVSFDFRSFLLLDCSFKLNYCVVRFGTV